MWTKVDKILTCRAYYMYGYMNVYGSNKSLKWRLRVCRIALWFYYVCTYIYATSHRNEFFPLLAIYADNIPKKYGRKSYKTIVALLVLFQCSLISICFLRFVEAAGHGIAKFCFCIQTVISIHIYYYDLFVHLCC